MSLVITNGDPQDVRHTQDRKSLLEVSQWQCVKHAMEWIEIKLTSLQWEKCAMEGLGTNLSF